MAGGFAQGRGEAAYPEYWDDSLVALYAPRIGHQGGTLRDLSRTRSHGTLTNMEANGDYVDTPIGRGLQFGGTDEYVDCGTVTNHEITTTGTWLMDFRIDGTVAGTEHILVARGADVAFGVNGTRWYMTSDSGTIYVGSKIAASAFTTAGATGFTPVSGTFYRLAARFDNTKGTGEKFRYFIDGLEYAGTTNLEENGDFLSDALPMTLARLDGTGAVNLYGQVTIREFALYNAALPTEVMLQWSKGASGLFRKQPAYAKAPAAVARKFFLIRP